MKRGPTFFQIAAVISSMLLVGAYIWFRTGTAADRREPVGEHAATGQRPVGELPTIMPGSKSAPAIAPGDAVTPNQGYPNGDPYAIEPPATEAPAEPPTGKKKAVMPGSKSMLPISPEDLRQLPQSGGATEPAAVEPPSSVPFAPPAAPSGPSPY